MNFEQAQMRELRQMPMLLEACIRKFLLEHKLSIRKKVSKFHPDVKTWTVTITRKNGREKNV